MYRDCVLLCSYCAGSTAVQPLQAGVYTRAGDSYSEVRSENRFGLLMVVSLRSFRFSSTDSTALHALKKKKEPAKYRYDRSLDPQLSWDINADRKYAETLIDKVRGSSS